MDLRKKGNCSFCRSSPENEILNLKMKHVFLFRRVRDNNGPLFCKQSVADVVVVVVVVVVVTAAAAAAC